MRESVDMIRAAGAEPCAVLIALDRMERGGGWSFPRLVLGVNGDMMSGTIHEVERHSDAPNVIPGTAELRLSVRAMQPEIRDLLGSRGRAG